MVGQLKNIHSLFVLIVSIIFLQSCNSLPTKHYQTLPVSQQTSTELVDQTILTTLEKLGYRVDKGAGDPGKFVGLMKVPKDIWNRDYRLTVHKTSGKSGSNVLLVEAKHCSGCVVTSGDQLSPASRVQAFTSTFSHILNQQIQANSSKKSSGKPNLSIYEQYFSGEKVRQPRKPTEKSIQRIPEETSSSEPVISPDEAKQAITENVQPKSSDVPDKPSIKIASLVVQPLNVPATSTFDVSFIMKVSDLMNANSELAVQVHYEIWLGKDRLFSSEKTGISVPNGDRVKRVEHVRAGSIIGEYQIRVIVAYQDDEAIKQANFKIINVDKR